MSRFIFLLAALAITSCSMDEIHSDKKMPADKDREGIVYLQLHSQIFGNTRTLRIWTPPGYDSNENRNYPVVYMNDGQNIFNDAASISGSSWQIEQIAEDLIEKGAIEPILIVGIDHPGLSERPNEYLPFEDIYLTPPMPEPNGEAYPNFLLAEVAPLIESQFRIDQTRRYLGGSSYGGLIALYTAIKTPEEYNGMLIESPSLYVDDAKVLNMAAETDDWPARIYIGIGTHEGRAQCRDDNAVPSAVEDVRKLETLLKNNADDVALDVVVEDCGLHHEDYWRRRMPRALTFLFSSTRSAASANP